MTAPDPLEEVAREVRNWGRWGSDDERGTLNLLTSDARMRGVDAVKDATSWPLALPLGREGPQAGLIPGRDNPMHRMLQVNQPMADGPHNVQINDDALDVALQAATHWDALAHVSYAGHLYNGFPANTVTEQGAAHCGIDKVGTVIGPVVLLDVASARGLDRLPPGAVVSPDDLDAAVEQARTTVQPGDIVLLRTGQIRAFLTDGDRLAYAYPSAGPGIEAARWFRHRDVAAVATDNLTFEVFPGERDDVILPVHRLHLVEMGLLQGQNFNLESLAEACAADRRYRGLLSATPAPVVGGVGGLVAPVVVR